MAADLTAVQISQLTGLNRNTVNRLLACLRQRMAEACESSSPLSGTIEVDESYFGPRRVKGKAGRGAGKKTRPEVAFHDLNFTALDRPRLLTLVGDALTKMQLNVVGRTHRQAGQPGRI